MTKFKLGDSVIATKDFENVRKGMTGTVVHFWSNDWVGVEWDDFDNGHGCDGYAKWYSGYYLKPDCLEHFELNLLNE